MDHPKYHIADLLPIVLEIVVHHHVVDQSESMDYEETKRVDSRDIRPGDEIPTGSILFGSIRVEEINDEKATIKYGDLTKALHLGEDWAAATEIVDNSPYPNRDEMTLTISYYLVTPMMRITELMGDILAIHQKKDSSVIPETADDEQKVLQIIDFELDHGELGLYPLKALLSSCNNWHTAQIVRLGQFREILLEGIEKGALSPHDKEGWGWLKIAAETNDAQSFMTDIDRYYNMLSAAAENGITEAVDIMNGIWEPEQLIEED